MAFACLRGQVWDADHAAAEAGPAGDVGEGGDEGDGAGGGPVWEDVPFVAGGSRRYVRGGFLSLLDPKTRDEKVEKRFV